MSELILGIIILALIGFIAWREKHFVSEKQQLMAFKLSETATEFKIVTEAPKKEEPTKVSSDFIEEQSLSDDEFFEAIKKSNGTDQAQ
jgi:hypothetical protein